MLSKMKYIEAVYTNTLDMLKDCHAKLQKFEQTERNLSTRFAALQGMLNFCVDEDIIKKHNMKATSTQENNRVWK